MQDFSFYAPANQKSNNAELSFSAGINSEVNHSYDSIDFATGAKWPWNRDTWREGSRTGGM